MSATRTPRRLLWFAVGACAAPVAWWLTLPWDMSEIDRSGRPTGISGDEYAWNIVALGAIGLIVVVAVSVVVMSPMGQIVAFGWITGMAATLSWVAMTARVSGANLYLASFVMFVGPLCVLSAVLAWWLIDIGVRVRRMAKWSHVTLTERFDERGPRP